MSAATLGARAPNRSSSLSLWLLEPAEARSCTSSPAHDREPNDADLQIEELALCVRCVHSIHSPTPPRIKTKSDKKKRRGKKRRNSGGALNRNAAFVDGALSLRGSQDVQRTEKKKKQNGNEFKRVCCRCYLCWYN